MSELAVIDTTSELNEFEESNELVAPVTIEHNDFQSFLKLAKQLPQMEVAINLVAKYFDFREGQTARGVFTGFVPVQKKDNDGVLQTLTCAQWMDDAGNVWLCAGMTLLETLQRFGVTPGTPLEITHTGKSGRCKLYDVKLLRPVEVAEDPSEKEALIRNLYDTAKVSGIMSKEAVFQHCSSVLGRQVTSASQLSVADINAVIENLDSKPPF